MPRIVCVSDTHLRHAELGPLPEGDVLLVAGDTTRRGTPAELAEVDDWLARQPHRHRIVIAGNHDFGLESASRPSSLFPHATYLQDGLAYAAGLRIWGSPWQPVFFDWAFNLPRGPALAAVWAKIPAGVDVLVTHGPPRGVLDRTGRGEEVGCDDLRAALLRVRPRLHVFGHIHEAHGRLAGVGELAGTLFVNASVCPGPHAGRGAPLHPPIVVDL